MFVYDFNVMCYDHLCECEKGHIISTRDMRAAYSQIVQGVGCSTVTMGSGGKIELRE